MADTFQDQLRLGQLGESDISRWLRSRGKSVLPVYEKEIDTGKGPRFFIPGNRQLVAPDMFVMPQMEWIEAKHKTVFTWHRNSKRWCTGIDLHHYAEYQQVQEVSGRRVWLFFLHRSALPDQRDLKAGCPPQCPTGLFAGSLDYLKEHKSHTHDNWGRHGMIYWAHESLKLIAPLSEVSGCRLNVTESRLDGIF